MHSRERVAAPALSQLIPQNSNQLSSPTAQEVVLSLDASARFYHYGPQGCRSGWVRGSKGPDGREWDTPITWNEPQAWKDALAQLQAHQPVEVDKRSTSEDQVELTPGGMYPKVTDAEGHTLHSPHCKAAFARRDWQCFRCCELLHGSAPRSGWQRPFFAKKLRQIQKCLLFPNEVAR